jgi:undecaprenyl-phosphate 4-deoxy-4-formamido-L-arabinose transferase
MSDVEPCITISVVMPVYKGEKTLAPLVDEIASLTTPSRSPHGRSFRVDEVIMVNDGAVDDSQSVMQALAARYSFVRLVWLSRNFGQHPATLAGCASSTSDWVITMDEDGDHDPADIPRLLDVALESAAQLVYALPSNTPGHGRVRNLASSLTKRFLVRLLLGTTDVSRFHSFRLIKGEIARSLAAYCGYKVYLDVALSWVVAKTAYCPVLLRNPSERTSGYNYRRLSSHFWRLVLTSGTRPLRLMSLLGLASILFGFVVSGIVLWSYFAGRIPIAGYTSLIIVICFFSGVILLSLGVVAEYLGVALGVSMGRPLYLVVSQPPVREAAAGER